MSKPMTNYNERLDEILSLHMPIDKNHAEDAMNIKQAVTDWHNKQTLELLERLASESRGVKKHLPGLDVTEHFGAVPMLFIERERKRLKESK